MADGWLDGTRVEAVVDVDAGHRLVHQFQFTSVNRQLTQTRLRFGCAHRDWLTASLALLKSAVWLFHWFRISFDNYEYPNEIIFCHRRLSTALKINVFRSQCYFASTFYSTAYLFRIISFCFFSCILYHVACAFVICLIKYIYLLTYLLKQQRAHRVGARTFWTQP